MQNTIKNILITGGAGYIGSACVAALLKVGHKVTIFDNFSTGQHDKVPVGAFVIDGDITNMAAIDAVVGSAHFDAVIHFAAKKSVGESEENPSLYFNVNVIGSLHLLQAIERHAVPQLIFSSSAAVYEPSTSDVPVTEATPTKPVSVYGTTKLMVEDMIESYARTGKLEQYTILRYFNVAGDAGLCYKEHDAQNVFPLLADATNKGTPFHVFGTDYDTRDGTCVRDYIHLTDLVDAHVRALGSPQSATYNLGTGTGYTVNELVTMFEQVSGKKMTIVNAVRRPGDSASVTASAKQATIDLGWEPQHTLEEMVKSTLKVFQ
jgi:UDP-glucose 4-epimerase